jgi:hypothetical protein
MGALRGQGVQGKLEQAALESERLFDKSRNFCMADRPAYEVNKIYFISTKCFDKLINFILFVENLSTVQANFTRMQFCPGKNKKKYCFIETYVTLCESLNIEACLQRPFKRMELTSKNSHSALTQLTYFSHFTYFLAKN